MWIRADLGPTKTRGRYSPAAQLGGQHIERCKTVTQNVAALLAKPAFEHRGVDLAEVGVVFEIAVVEIGQRAGAAGHGQLAGVFLARDRSTKGERLP